MFKKLSATFLIVVMVLSVSPTSIFDRVNAQTDSSEAVVQNVEVESVTDSTTSYFANILNKMKQVVSNMLSQFSFMSSDTDIVSNESEENWPLSNLSQEAPPADTNWTRRGGSLSVDLQGWTNNPTITSDGNTVYAAWTQHRNPSVWEYSGIRVSMFKNGVWTPLGGRIGHTRADASWPSAYDPSITTINGVPYVAWQEGGGYGWNGNRSSSIFVSKWNGSSWDLVRNTEDTVGALNTVPETAARNPRLANVGGVLYAAWVENFSNTERNVHRVIVKKFNGTSWSLVGTISNGTLDGHAHNIIDLAVTDVNSELYIAWSEFDRVAVGGELQIPRSQVHVAKVSNNTLTRVGSPLNRSSEGRANYLSITESQSKPYVAWQEKAPAGNYQIFVSHWDGTKWASDGGALNFDNTNGEAGRPALSGDSSGVWLSWVEGVLNQHAHLRARHLNTSGVWSSITGSLNYSTTDGTADSPEVTIVNGVPYVVWTEKHFPSATKQVYVTAADKNGNNATDVLTQYGADGPTLNPPPNTWIKVNAGGITQNAQGVGDEGYSSLSYVPAIKRSVVFGKYHATDVSMGEDQNALLAYDSLRNRWDIVEITETSWSEHLPGSGHDEGHVAIDPVKGLYITQGNLSLHGGTRYNTYIYDLIAGRGKRMLPVTAVGPGYIASTATFDTKRNYVYMTPFRYDVSRNRWDILPGCSTGRWFDGVAYDKANDRIVQFGGHVYGGPPHADQTRIISLDALTCVSESHTTKPPAGYSHLTFNSKYNVIMAITGGDDSPFPPELWAYDGAVRKWSKVGSVPSDFPANASGQNLTYDEDRDLLLYHNGTDLRNLLAFRYVPSTSGPSDTTAPSVPANLNSSGVTANSVSLTWNQSTDNVRVIGYNIYRDGIKVNSVATNSYTDSALQANTNYSYTVSAFDDVGNESAKSSSVSVTTLTNPTNPSDTTAPSVPANLNSSGVTANSVSLTWNQSTDNVGVTGYKIYRNNQLLKSVSASPLSYTDTLLTPDTTYTYAVSAVDLAGNESGKSTTLSVITLSGSVDEPPLITGVTVQNIQTTPPFSQTNNCVTTLDGNESCTVNVTFTPTSASSANGQLSIDTSAGQKAVPLSGTGFSNSPTDPVDDTVPVTPNKNFGANGIEQKVWCPNGSGGFSRVTKYEDLPNDPIGDGVNGCYMEAFDTSVFTTNGLPIQGCSNLDMSKFPGHVCNEIRTADDFATKQTLTSNTVSILMNDLDVPSGKTAWIGGTKASHWLIGKYDTTNMRPVYLKTATTPISWNSSAPINDLQMVNLRINSGGHCLSSGGLQLVQNNVTAQSITGKCEARLVFAGYEAPTQSETFNVTDFSKYAADDKIYLRGMMAKSKNSHTIYLDRTYVNWMEDSIIYGQGLGGKHSGKFTGENVVVRNSVLSNAGVHGQPYLDSDPAWNGNSKVGLAPFSLTACSRVVLDGLTVLMHYSTSGANPQSIQWQTRDALGAGCDLPMGYYPNAYPTKPYYGPLMYNGQKYTTNPYWTKAFWDSIDVTKPMTDPGMITSYLTNTEIIQTYEDESIKPQIFGLMTQGLVPTTRDSSMQNWQLADPISPDWKELSRIVVSGNCLDNGLLETNMTRALPDIYTSIVNGSRISPIDNTEKFIKYGTNKCANNEDPTAQVVQARDAWVSKLPQPRWVNWTAGSNQTALLQVDKSYGLTSAVTNFFVGVVNKAKNIVSNISSRLYPQVASVTDITYTVSTSQPSIDFGNVAIGSSKTQSLVVTVSSSSVPTTPTPDTSAPSTPTNLQPSGVTTSSISLTWNQSTDNVGVTGYNIYRNGMKVNSVSTNSYTDSALQVSTNYIYTVSAIDAAGNESAKSSSVSVSTLANPLDTTAPSTPAGLSLSSLSTDSVTFGWNQSTDSVGVTGYKIYRNNQLLKSVSASPLSYTDTSLTPDTTYTYAVSAVDLAGNESAKSTTLSVTTNKLADSSFSILKQEVSSIQNDSAIINVSLSEVGYATVDYGRKTNDLNSKVESLSEKAEHSLSITNLSNGTIYYRVTATNSEGDKEVSDVMSFQISKTSNNKGGGGGGNSSKSDRSTLEPASVDSSFTTYSTSDFGTFDRNIVIGSEGEDVMRLQQLLNSDPDTQIAVAGDGAPGYETTFFGTLTAMAVGKFQLKHGILKSVNDEGYGQLGPMTRAKINEMSGNPTINVTNDNRITLQAQINKLLEAVRMLQQQLAQKQGVNTYSPSVVASGFQGAFTRNLAYGSEGEDVKRLQQLLNSDPDTQIAVTGDGAPGYETTFFGSGTEDAVKRFQVKYGIVYSGTPETTGYGAFGPSTRAMAEQL